MMDGKFWFSPTAASARRAANQKVWQALINGKLMDYTSCRIKCVTHPPEDYEKKDPPAASARGDEVYLGEGKG